ncbi:AAA family ATPase [Algoriphagus sp.]|uniref:AAA family ATPase n=1 Tax=Algoriphagus sp. TaxID=1872435 RepID=UPI002613D1BC|nr:AAA family ATPase [Algoriphagus sp.]
MITRIEIKGYKSIKSLEIDLRPINILLGGNGVGKSNLISIFGLIRNIYNQNLQNYIQKKGGPDSLLHFGRKETDQISFSVFFKSSQDYENKFMIDLELGQNRLFIKSIRTAFKWNNNWREVEYERNVNESEFSENNTGQAFWVNGRLQEFDVYHFHDTSDTSPIKGLADLNDNHYLKRDGSNLAAFLYYLKLKEPKHFKRIEMMVKSIAPFFDRFDLEPNFLNENKIELEWKEVGYPDSYFNAYHLSDGTLRFICLATLFMQPNPPETIIVDEPELGLHPVAINKLAAMIRKASENVQIILSTQSTNLIDNFSPEDVIVTDREGSESVFRRLRSEDLSTWMNDYTLGDLWGQNKLGAQPYSI